MKFTLSWLKDHLETDASLDQILDTLNRIGLEVEGVENPGDRLRDFRVAKVLSAVQHPNADRLRLLSVDAGSDLNDGEPWQVVCGAPNAREGMMGVFAAPGTYIPGSDFTLAPAKIRDVESFGMMCSARELELGEDHDGIIKLADDAPVGTPYPEFAGLDDPVIDVSVTPNRQDCMGVRGIARDLAAAGLGTLKSLDAPEVDGTGDAPDIAITDPDGCPAFYARAVTGVTNAASPGWMQRRLLAIGQKPISALVDITNYLMVDLGRPLHVYDRAKLSGTLTARAAKEGEAIVALNGKTYRLSQGMTVIADDARVHDIGGIMGGAHSGASESTTDVLIECAYFDPDAIARTGQKLMLTSDARSRFERGVDPAFLDDGLGIATRMVTDLCGGTPGKAARKGEPPTKMPQIAFDPARTLALAGIEIEPDRQADILEALGFTVSRGATFEVTPPTWRRDVEGPADLVEEVVRITGLDSIPSTPLTRAPGVARPTATPDQLRERRARRAAAASGLNEAVTWSFISEADASAVGGPEWKNYSWIVANPISEDLRVMRTSLLPGLLAAAKRNRARGAETVRLFEIGRRYFRERDGSSDERPTLALVLAGSNGTRDWQSGKPGPFAAYDAKAEAEAILGALGVDTEKLMVLDVEDAGAPVWHPGQSASMRLGPRTVLAEFGMLHPGFVKAMGMKGAVAAAQIFLDAIPQARSSDPVRPAFAPPALQSVTRDFAFLVDEALASSELVRAIRGADKNAITEARVFDRFTGEGVPQGKASIAIEVTLQPTGDKSFTDEELKAISDRVVAAAAAWGGELRG